MNTPARFSEPTRAIGFPQPPSADSFPSYPASWYLFCQAHQLRHGPLAKRFLGRDLVAFRTESGKVIVLDGRCSHLGADLGCGKVVGEAIQCPFHHWQFGCDGVCEKIPGATEIPRFARQQCYPAVERHGLLFMFNGPVQLFPLPFFYGDDPAELVAGKPFAFVAHATWFMVAGQGFDTQHFETVHDRRLCRPPEIDCPAPFARRTRYDAEIIGQSGRDRLLRLVVGPNVALTIMNWGGTFLTVKAEFLSACSRFIVSSRPLEDGRTLCEVIVFARRGAPALGLPARRWLTRAHLEAEARQVRNTHYRPARFIPADSDLIHCLQWLAALPQTAQLTETPRTNGAPVDRVESTTTLRNS